MAYRAKAHGHQFRPAQRPGIADQQQDAVAQPPEPIIAGGEQAAGLEGGQGGGLADGHAALAMNAAQRMADPRIDAPGQRLQPMRRSSAAKRRSSAARLWVAARLAR